MWSPASQSEHSNPSGWSRSDQPGEDDKTWDETRGQQGPAGAGSPLSNEPHQNKHVNNQAALHLSSLLSRLTSLSTKLSRTGSEDWRLQQNINVDQPGGDILYSSQPLRPPPDKIKLPRLSQTCFYPSPHLFLWSDRESIGMNVTTTNGLRYGHGTLGQYYIEIHMI